MDFNKLKKILDELYISYKHAFSSKDPVWLLHTFNDERDAELAGFITAVYTYGSVDQINKFTRLFMERLNNKPYEFIINFSKHKDKKYLEGLNYRFNTSGDAIKLVNALNSVIIKYGSLKNLFLAGYNNEDKNIIPALTYFSKVINSYIPSPLGREGRGLKSFSHYMVSNPAGGSASKRMNLFLRWMVRKDEIDPGLWDDIPASKLIIPVDTHIARVSKKLNLVKRKSVDIKFAIELTETLKRFDAGDPVKYDFSLCHMGIDKKPIPEGLFQIR